MTVSVEFILTKIAQYMDAFHANMDFRTNVPNAILLL